MVESFSWGSWRPDEWVVFFLFSLSTQQELEPETDDVGIFAQQTNLTSFPRIVWVDQTRHGAAHGRGEAIISTGTISIK